MSVRAANDQEKVLLPVAMPQTGVNSTEDDHNYRLLVGTIAALGLLTLAGGALHFSGGSFSDAAPLLLALAVGFIAARTFTQRPEITNSPQLQIAREEPIEVIIEGPQLRAEEMLAQALEMVRELPANLEKVKVLLSAAEMSEKIGDEEGARALAEEIIALLDGVIGGEKKEKVKHYACNYSLLMGLGDPERALEMIGKASTLADEIFDFQDNRSALYNIFSALVEGEHFEKALGFARKLGFQGLECHLPRLREYLLEEERFDEALETTSGLYGSQGEVVEGIVGKMASVDPKGALAALEANLEVVKGAGAEIYRKICHEMAEREEFDEALTIASKIKGELSKKYAFCDIYKTIARKGDPERALALVDEAGDEAYKKDTSEAIAEAFVEKGEYSRAMEIASRGRKSVSRNINSAIALKLADEGKFEEAVDRAVIATSSDDDWVAGNLFERIFEKLVEVDCFDEGIRLLPKVPEGKVEGIRVQESKVRDRACTCLAKGLIAKGDLVKAFDIGWSVPAIVEAVVDTLVERNDISGALEALNRFSKGWEKGYLFERIANISLERDELDRAIRIATLLVERCNERSQRILAKIAAIHAKKGDMDKAIEVVTSGLNSFESRNKAFQKASKRVAKAGNIEGAVELARQISSDQTREQAFGDISKVIVEQNLTDDVLEVLNGVPEKNVLFAQISSELAKAGHLEKAREVANLIDDLSLRSLTFLDISQMLADEGDFARAKDTIGEIPHLLVQAGALLELSKMLAKN